MTRARALTICFAALVSLALLAAPIAAAPPPPETETTSTTVPDDTYGEGGTRQSFSNDKHEVMAEVWRDKNRIVREQFEVSPDGAQLWGFFNGDGSGKPSEWRRSMIAIRAMDRPVGRWEMWVIGADDTLVKQLSTLTRAEVDTEFAYWHAQLRIWVNTARRRQQGETN
jgi:hypothetical protein